MSKHDLTIFTLTRNGISTIAELEQMTNEQIARIRGMSKRGYDEILTVLGRNDDGIKNVTARQPLPELYKEVNV